jgi:hypothetical protein
MIVHVFYAELQLIHFTNYLLGAKYCMNIFLKSSVCIFVTRNLKYKSINIDEYNIDKDIEVCEIQLDLNCSRVYILSIYRFVMVNLS